MDKLRLRIKSYDQRLIDNSCRQIVDVLERSHASIVGPIPLPTEFRKYTINRASFVYKNSREQFELRVHKRIIDILNPASRLIESLSDLNLPVGVDIEIKMI